MAYLAKKNSNWWFVVVSLIASSGSVLPLVLDLMVVVEARVM